jgi:hypothetical protein
LVTGRDKGNSRVCTPQQSLFSASAFGMHVKYCVLIVLVVLIHETKPIKQQNNSGDDGRCVYYHVLVLSLAILSVLIFPVSVYFISLGGHIFAVVSFSTAILGISIPSTDLILFVGEEKEQSDHFPCCGCCRGCGGRVVSAPPYFIVDTNETENVPLGVQTEDDFFHDEFDTRENDGGEINRPPSGDLGSWHMKRRLLV